jgi:hypothetical protein
VVVVVLMSATEETPDEMFGWSFSVRRTLLGHCWQRP